MMAMMTSTSTPFVMSELKTVTFRREDILSSRSSSDGDVRSSDTSAAMQLHDHRTRHAQPSPTAAALPTGTVRVRETVTFRAELSFRFRPFPRAGQSCAKGPKAKERTKRGGNGGIRTCRSVRSRYAHAARTSLALAWILLIVESLPGWPLRRR